MKGKSKHTNKTNEQPESLAISNLLVKERTLPWVSFHA